MAAKAIDNQMRLIEYKKFNLNLSPIEIYNNVLYFEDDYLDLNNFLLSSLLNCPDFVSKENTLSARDFWNIIKANVFSANIMEEYVLNKKEKNIDENEYINHIVKKEDSLMIITNNKRKYVFKNNIDRIMEEYKKLEYNNNYYISLLDFLKKLNVIDENSNNLEYFNLLMKKDLSNTEIKKIKDFEDLTALLQYYQDYLIDDARILFSLFKKQLYTLEIKDTKTNAEQDAIKRHQEINELYIKEMEAQYKKEEAYKHSSKGYSSLVLLITSTLITSLFITYLTFIICR